MHADDGHRADAVVVHLLEVGLQGVKVWLTQNGAIGGHPLVDLDDAVVQQVGQDDVPVEDAGAVLVADPQRVPETLRHHERGRLAGTFEKGVGGNGRAHPYGLDPFGRNGLVGTETEELTDAGHGRVGVSRGIVRQQLVRAQRPVWSPRDDVGERAAPVDPELPRSTTHVLTSSPVGAAGPAWTKGPVMHRGAAGPALDEGTLDPNLWDEGTLHPHRSPRPRWTKGPFMRTARPRLSRVPSQNSTVMNVVVWVNPTRE